ncbi:MAG: hypothetical protein [Bacteriophage sp.]|nr:MAG: hypothetical protein [Bacteriophage sp.]
MIKELTSPNRFTIAPGATGTIHAKEEVMIPEGYVGIISIRRKFGNMGLIQGSQFIGDVKVFTGRPEIQLYNAGVNPIEIFADEPVVNMAIVKAYEEGSE